MEELQVGLKALEFRQKLIRQGDDQSEDVAEEYEINELAGDDDDPKCMESREGSWTKSDAAQESGTTLWQEVGWRDRVIWLQQPADSWQLSRVAH